MVKNSVEIIVRDGEIDSLNMSSNIGVLLHNNGTILHNEEKYQKFVEITFKDGKIKMNKNPDKVMVCVTYYGIIKHEVFSGDETDV